MKLNIMSKIWLYIMIAWLNQVIAQQQQPIALLVPSTTNKADLELSADGLEYLERLADKPVAFLLFIKQKSKMMMMVRNESNVLFESFTGTRQQSTSTSPIVTNKQSKGVFMWPREIDMRSDIGFETESQTNSNQTTSMPVTRLFGVQVYTELAGLDKYEFMRSSGPINVNRMMGRGNSMPVGGQQRDYDMTFQAKSMALMSLLASHIIYETQDNETRLAYNDFDALWIDYQRVEALKSMVSFQINWNNFDQQTLDMATLTRINVHQNNKNRNNLLQEMPNMINFNDTNGIERNIIDNMSSNEINDCSVQMMPSLINYQLLLLSNGLDRGQLKSYDHQRCDTMINQITENVIPKQMAGQPMNGSRMIGLIKDLLMTLNNENYADWLYITSLNSCETFFQLKLQDSKNKRILNGRMAKETKATLIEWIGHFASLMLRGFPEEQAKASRYMRSIMACRLNL